MKILADQCVNTDVVDALRKIGLAVEKAIEKRLEMATDEEIFNHILKTGQILLTFDKDFGNIIRFNIRRSQGVVIVYVEGMSRAEIILRTTEFFQKTKEKELKGGLFLIEPKRIRIWRH